MRKSSREGEQRRAIDQERRHGDVKQQACEVQVWRLARWSPWTKLRKINTALTQSRASPIRRSASPLLQQLPSGPKIAGRPRRITIHIFSHPLCPLHTLSAALTPLHCQLPLPRPPRSRQNCTQHGVLLLQRVSAWHRSPFSNAPCPHPPVQALDACLFQSLGCLHPVSQFHTFHMHVMNTVASRISRLQPPCFSARGLLLLL